MFGNIILAALMAVSLHGYVTIDNTKKEKRERRMIVYVIGVILLYRLFL